LAVALNDADARITTAKVSLTPVYVRTYIKRQEHWQLLAEHLETIPAERTAVKIDTKVYDDYVGRYESAIFDFEVVKGKNYDAHQSRAAAG
jgi:hypothetical protein